MTKWESCNWPMPEDEGNFKIECSCTKWSFEGTAKEITEASRKHDDSPWTNHIVAIVGKEIKNNR